MLLLCGYFLRVLFISLSVYLLPCVQYLKKNLWYMHYVMGSIPVLRMIFLRL